MPLTDTVKMELPTYTRADELPQRSFWMPAHKRSKVDERIEAYTSEPREPSRAGARDPTH